MGTPLGNKNAAGPHGAGQSTKRRKRAYAKNVKGRYGEKVQIIEIHGHNAITDKGNYHTSHLFNKKGKSIWKRKGY